MYRPRQTVYDLRTREYYKIETTKEVKLYGAWRTFYKLLHAPGSQPEDAWREAYELSPTATPTTTALRSLLE